MIPRVIRRPKRYERLPVDVDVLAALLQTAHDAHAVVVPVPPGDSTYGTYNRYRSRVIAEGYRFHGRVGRDGSLVAWVTQPKEQP